MILQSPIREFVLRTQSFGPLRRLYRHAYDRALGAAAGELAAVEGVNGVFVRDRGEDPGWFAGLSDLDLSIAACGAGAAERVAFLERLWERYQRLKRRFPMLGEVEVLFEEQWNVQCELGPLPQNHRKQLRQLAGGTAVMQSALSTHLAHRLALREVVFRYCRFVVPRWVTAWESPSRLHREEAGHSLRALNAQLDRLEVDAVGEARGSSELEQVLLRLDCMALQVLSGEARERVEGNPAAVVEWENGVHPGLRCRVDLWREGESFREKLETLRRVRHRQEYYWAHPHHTLLAPLVEPTLMTPALWALYRELHPLEVEGSSAGMESLREHGRSLAVAWGSLMNNWRILSPSLRQGFYEGLAARIRGARGRLQGGAAAASPIAQSLVEAYEQARVELVQFVTLLGVK